MDELRRGAIVVNAAEDEPLAKALELIEGFGLPGGLLPLEEVVEAGYVEETGFVWITQKKRIEHCFKRIERMVSYGEEITCTLEKNGLKKLSGVKAKELLLWVPVNEILVEEPPSTNVHFKSLIGISRTFPAEAFARGE